jgi:SAM-dependent methyltransferase
VSIELNKSSVRQDGSRATISVSGEPIVWARQLTDRHVANCRVFPSREELISTMLVRAVCAEVGVQTGYFSAQILNRTAPRKLHLLDLSISQIRYDLYPELRSAVESGTVQLHEGSSAQILSTFPDSYFDWLYIDGDHSFAGVVMDIKQAIRAVKPEGLIVFNDYVKYSPLELSQYGVMEAVNDLCLAQDFEMVAFALHGLGYFDVALRKIREDADLAMVSKHSAIRRFFKRAQSGKVPLGFEEPQFALQAVPGDKLPPIGNRRDPLLEASPERSPWTPAGLEEDIFDEARRGMRDEYSSKPKIVRPDRLL